MSYPQHRPQQVVSTLRRRETKMSLPVAVMPPVEAEGAHPKV